MPSDTRGNAINAPVGLTRGWARFLQAPRHKKITTKVALGGEVCFPTNKSLVQEMWIYESGSLGWFLLLGIP